MPIVVKKNHVGKIVEVYVRKEQPESIFDKISHPCDTCELRHQFFFVPPQGSKVPDLYMLGDYPDMMSKLTLDPFEGIVHQTMNSVLQMLDSMNIRWFNALNCPPFDKKGHAMHVSSNMLSCCSAYVYEDLKTHRPKGILAMGVKAARVMGCIQSGLTMKEARGNLYMIDGVPIMPTWHPKYLSAKSKTTGFLFDQFVGDVGMLIQAMRSKAG